MPFLVEHLHAAKAGNAVRDVNDQIAIGQIEEAVNRARFEPPPWQHLPCLLAVKQLVIAENDNARAPAVFPCRCQNAKPGSYLAGHQAQPARLGQLPPGQHLAQAFAFSVVVTSNQYPVPGCRMVQFLGQLADGAAESLNRFDAQVASCFHRGTRQGSEMNIGKAQELPENRLHREQSEGLGHPFQVMLPLFLEISRLNEHRPGIGRQIIAQMPPFAGASRRRERGDQENRHS